MGTVSKVGFDIVIPNWNNKDLLKICLDSLLAQTYRQFDIIVVDNGSVDGSVSFIENRYPQVTVIALPRNEGFSAAVNRGIEKCRRDWVVLLNNDIEVEKNCLERLAAHTSVPGCCDMMALKMLAYDRRTILDGAGDAVLRGGVGYRLGTMEHDGPHYSLRREVFGACAGAAVYRRSLFAEIGLFDEDFFAYLEDVDLNFRAVRAGCRCLYVPDAIVYHVGSASTGSKINRLTIRLSTRNNIFILCKHYSFSMLMRVAPALVIYQFFWLLFVIKKGQLSGYIKGVAGGVSGMLRMRKKHRNIKRYSTLSEGDLMKAVIASERQAIDSIMARRRQENKNNCAFRLYKRILC